MAPEVGAYLGNYLAAQGMFLHKRDDRDQITFRNEDDLNTWMYVKGRYHENDAGGDKVSYDTTTTVLQVGSDFMSKPMDNGILRAGGMFGAGQAKTHSDAKHNVRDAQGKVDGFNVGLYATWQEDQKLRLGSYVDTWAAYSWYNNKSPATATTKTTIAKVSPRLLKSATRGLSSQKMNVPGRSSRRRR